MLTKEDIFTRVAKKVYFLPISTKHSLDIEDAFCASLLRDIMQCVHPYKEMNESCFDELLVMFLCQAYLAGFASQ